MARAARVAAAVTAGAVLLAGAGYVTADAYDVVPGLVTLEPVADPPPPFPQAPGAVEAPPVTPVVATVDPEVPLPDADRLVEQAQAAATHEWMGTSVGVVVADQLTGEVLVDLDGERPRTPASTAKLVTALAAIVELGPGTTFTTSVVRSGPDRITLVGGGDVMLGAGAGDPDEVNGRAGLVDLAAQTARALRLAGTTEVDLALDDTVFSGPAASPGWAETDLSLGFVAAVTPLAVNIGKTRDEPYPPRHADPALHAARTFAALLAEQGITVGADVVRVPAGDGPQIAAVESAPVRDVVRYALHTSDNTVTEVLGRMVAVSRDLPGSFEGATRAVLAVAQEEGLDVGDARLADCSGLADGSLLPATLLVDLLRHVNDPTRTDLLPVAVDLPVAGWTGTLADRLTETPAEGLVRAKTGSLRGVTSLAGTVVTAEGRPLVFAVLADATPPGGQLGPRRVIDTFVQQLAGCECALP